MVVHPILIAFLSIVTGIAVGGKVPGSKSCVLPEHPENGRYQLQGTAIAESGKGTTFLHVILNTTCEEGFAVDGDTTAFCVEGIWSREPPKCKRYCNLQPHHSVNYACKLPEGMRPCRDVEFSGTTAVPSCKTPYYHGSVSNMRCLPNGLWDQEAKCSPECGRITPSGVSYVLEGKRARHAEFPWHAAIYRKDTKPYRQFCGGSLVSRKTVISAAHCFWSDTEGKRPPSLYAVALGKLYRPWSDPNDADAQFSNVTEIQVPKQFTGFSSNFQYDIAVVILETEIEYKAFIRPICVNFDSSFNANQLQPGNEGKVSAWGSTAADGKVSPVLVTVNLPYVSLEQCIAEVPFDFREYITGDKFCAGFRNETTLCEGNSGGGLAFPEFQLGEQRYYLRGVVSTAPRNDGKCNPNVKLLLTEIQFHEQFIKEFVDFAA